MIFAYIQKYETLTKLQEKQICLFFKGSSAHLTRGRALRTLIVASFKRLENVFVHAKYIRTPCIRTMHVNTKFSNAFVTPTTRGKCTTQRISSQFLHTCLQRKIGSCRGGELCDGYVEKFSKKKKIAL